MIPFKSISFLKVLRGCGVGMGEVMARQDYFSHFKPIRDKLQDTEIFRSLKKSQTA